MLLVKTKIRSSNIAGIGLFADELIPKGKCIWKFKEGFGKDYPDTLEGAAKSFFSTYAYQNPTTLNYVLCADNARFFNHSDTPNTDCLNNPDDEDTMDVATRDIQIGEELTIDYRKFDANPSYGFDVASSTE